MGGSASMISRNLRRARDPKGKKIVYFRSAGTKESLEVWGRGHLLALKRSRLWLHWQRRGFVEVHSAFSEGGKGFDQWFVVRWIN